MDDRCVWTGRRSPRVVAIEIPGVDRLGRRRPPMTAHVLPEHADELVAYAARVQRWGLPFLVTVVGVGLLTALAGLLPVLTGAPDRVVSIVVGILVALLGLLVVVFPFVTPETVALLGVRRSVVLARVLALGLLVMGAAIALFG